MIPGFNCSLTRPGQQERKTSSLRETNRGRKERLLETNRSVARRACLPGTAQNGVSTRRRGDFFLPCPWQAGPHGRCVLILCCFCILFNPPYTKAVVQGYGDGDRNVGTGAGAQHHPTPLPPLQGPPLPTRWPMGVRVAPTRLPGPARAGISLPSSLTLSILETGAC